MQIRLNEDGLLARYYKWVTSSELPKSLCPYFWQMVPLVVFSPVIFAVYALYKLVCFLIEKMPESKELTWEEELRREKMWDRAANIFEIVGKVFVGAAITLSLGVLVFALVNEIREHGWIYVLKNVFSVIGMISVLVAVILGVFWVVFESEIFQKIGKSMVIQVPVQLVSGMYHKACPLIVWEGNKTPEVVVAEKVSQETV